MDGRTLRPPHYRSTAVGAPEDLCYGRGGRASGRRRRHVEHAGSGAANRRAFLRSRLGCHGTRRSIGRSGKGFKEQPSTYRISAAPTGRGRCRRCRNLISKGETRFEVCAFVTPGRYTLLLRCTKQKCIDAPLAAAILAVYKRADRVPVDAALEGGAEGTCHNLCQFGSI